MGFAFTNKPPATADSGGAFKPLPSLPGTRGLVGQNQGPGLKTENPAATNPRPVLVFGARISKVNAPLLKDEQGFSDSNSDSDALSFFLNYKVPSKRGVWDIKDDEEGTKPPSKFRCNCRRTIAPALTYQPSTAAHTIQQYIPCTPKSDSTTSRRPFRFLDLPGELRNRVYRAAISPGYVSLRSCAKHHFSVGVSPTLATGIFAASKQLAHETKDLVFESTFIVDVYLESGVRSVINPLQLPHHLLDKIQHITLVLDFTQVHTASPSRNDWRPIQAMTALKSLNICAIQMWPPAAMYSHSRTLQDHHRETIQTILECIPEQCAVDYGWQSQAEEEHIKEMHCRITRLPEHQRQVFTGAEIADPVELAAAASSIDKDMKRGWKNGSKVDFRFTRSES